MAQLKRRALEREYPQLREEDKTIPSLYTAIAEYVRLRSSGRPVTTRQQLVRSLSHYLIAPGSDIPLSAETLQKRLMERWKEPTLARDTVTCYAGAVQSFCRWCVEQGYIARNPIAALGDAVARPKAPASKSLTPEQVAAVVAACHDSKRWEMIFRLLYLTAMRPGEFVRLHWDDLQDDGILITGKRVLGRKVVRGEGDLLPYRERFFPLRDAAGREVIPGLPALLTEMRTHRDRLGSGLYVSPYTQPTESETRIGTLMHRHASELFRRAMGDASSGVSIKSLRKAGINYWRDVLHLPVDIRAILAGHTEAVQVSSYLTEQRYSDLQQRIAAIRGATA